MCEVIDQTADYINFRSVVPQKRICVDDDISKEWIVYDMGSKEVKCPLICLPPVSARADVFFGQLLYLSDRGYRVISVEYPVYWSWREFCNGFNKLLDHLQLNKVHLFGASLGGFLAQKFAEVTRASKQVQSLVLCNTFTDTSIFRQQMSASTFWLLPASVLKNMLIDNLDTSSTEPAIKESVKFLSKSLNSLNRKELASRLTLNCQSATVDTLRIRHLPITIIDVNDDCAISETVKDDLHSFYPSARRAHLKSGGNFPYLSKASDVNLYLEIHLREFNATAHSALEDMAETNIDVVLAHSGGCCAPQAPASLGVEGTEERGAEGETEHYHRQATMLNSTADSDKDVGASSYW